MPVRACKAPLCPALVTRGGWCDAHKHLAPKQDRRAYHRHYDQHQRDPDAKAFYNGAAWLAVRASVLADDPICRRCRRAWATTVHHKKPLAECSPAEKLDKNNLLGVCSPCHGEIEAEVRAAKVGR